MYLRTSKTCFWKYSNLILQNFFPACGLVWQAALKKTKVKLGLLTVIDTFLMVKKGIRGRMCQSNYTYAKANKKHIKELW